MAHAADTNNLPTAAHAAVINAAAVQTLTARNPRILRARARLRAIRRFKESARNK